LNFVNLELLVLDFRILPQDSSFFEIIQLWSEDTEKPCFKKATHLKP